MSETAAGTGETTVNPEVLIVLNKLKAAWELEMSTSRSQGDIERDGLSLSSYFGNVRIAYRVSTARKEGGEIHGETVWKRAKIDESGEIIGDQQDTAQRDEEPLSPEDAEAFVLEYGPKIADAIGGPARARVVAAIARYDAVMGTPASETAAEEVTN